MIHQAQTLPEVQRLEQAASHSSTPCGPRETTAWRRFGSGPPLVLLHGGSGSWNHWIRNIDALARSRTLWIPDLPGCGDSSLPPGAYDADSIFEHVATGIAQCSPGQPVDLIGFSFGSLVSGLIAAHHPQLVKRLILIAPPALGLHRPPLGLKSLAAKMSPEENEQALRHNLQRLMLHRASAIDSMAVALHAANFARDRLRLRRLARGEIMLELKTRWRCPVAAIWGREDALARKEIHRLHEVLDGCDLREIRVIDDAGHWVQYEEPAAFNDVLAQCLQ